MSQLECETPVFMPVGTLGALKGVPFSFLNDINIPIVLSNTYHLYLRPGIKIIEKSGGLGAFMGWDKAILTDSGGFQVYSLSDLSVIDDDGYRFKSHIDGSRHQFTPEKVIDLQKSFGSQFVMPLDECLSFEKTDHQKISQSVDRTIKWAEQSLDHFHKNNMADKQALFAIVQGSGNEKERERCAIALIKKDFFGYAIGGLSVGEGKEELYHYTQFTTNILPENKIRYLMGVGFPEDLFECVERGIDFFDCVVPTRNARNGTVFTPFGPRHLRNAQFTENEKPIDETCECYTCKNHSLMYLRHLFKAEEMNGPILASIHNITFYHNLMKNIRKSIKEDRFETHKKEWLANYLNKGIFEKKPD